VWVVFKRGVGYFWSECGNISGGGGISLATLFVLRLGMDHM
jgi:hypothetical protein